MDEAEMSIRVREGGPVLSNGDMLRDQHEPPAESGSFPFVKVVPPSKFVVVCSRYDCWLAAMNEETGVLPIAEIVTIKDNATIEPIVAGDASGATPPLLLGLTISVKDIDLLAIQGAFQQAFS